MKKNIKIVSFVIYIILSNLSFIPRVMEIITKGNWKNLIIYLVLWVIAILGLVIIFFSERKFVRLILGSLTILSAFLSMTYFNIGHHFLNFEDVELLWTARAMAMSAFSFYMNLMFIPLIISLVGILALVIQWSPRLLRQLNVRLLVTLSILPFFCQMAVTYKTAGYGTKAMPQQYLTLSVFSLFQGFNLFTPGILGKRDNVGIMLSHQDKSPQKIIFIVDESIRADYFNLVKVEKYLPYSSTHASRFINFGFASSGNNCSAYSNAILRMGGIKKHLEEIGHNPFIWSYAKKAGYTTYYIDGQLKHRELQNYLSGEELKLIDHFIQFDSTPEPMIDHEIAKRLRAIMHNKKERSFVYINKRGAHFPYVESYEQSQAIFLPQMSYGEKIGASKQRLINSYKNAIYWNTDQFFQILLQQQVLDHTIIFYTSDHGQNLMDRGIMTHCNTVDPVPFEGYVPLYVLTDIPNKRFFYEQGAKQNFNKLTHFAIFPSILKEMGFNAQQVTTKYGDGLNDIPQLQQEFSAGSILPRFGKDVQWFPIPHN